ncbi:hypothetical protein RDI58_008932 [Solanum bulbocastanum]|uniref:Uncharacterized protein n=1 Tax=Solanum bulbocastanum TaxID=147425 RepID=A0AAN8TYH9_SOLBU
MMRMRISLLALLALQLFLLKVVSVDETFGLGEVFQGINNSSEQRCGWEGCPNGSPVRIHKDDVDGKLIIDYVLMESGVEPHGDIGITAKANVHGNDVERKLMVNYALMECVAITLVGVEPHAWEDCGSVNCQSQCPIRPHPPPPPPPPSRR